MTLAPDFALDSAHFAPPTDARWAAALGRVPHDFYHLPCYAGLAAEREGGSPFGYVDRVADADVFLPLLVRPIPGGGGGQHDGRFDASCPYGYPGPVASRPLTAEEVTTVAERFRDRGRAAGLVSSFVRMHPALSPAEGWDAADQVTLVEHGPTVGVELESDQDAWLRSIRTSHRQDIARLVKEGYTVRLNEPGDDVVFRVVYTETMERIGAEASYFFSDAYFEQLSRCLGPRQVIATVLGPEGDVAAAGLFVVTSGLVQYHLGGTAAAHTRRAPSKLFLASVREWAAGQGHRLLHLGGGVGTREDSLFRFKKGFASTLYTFHTLRVVHDAPAFDALAADRGGDGGFFPPYRSVAS